MKKEELTQLLIESLNKKGSGLGRQELDRIKSKSSSKKIVGSIIQGQEHNEELLDKLIKNLKNESNPFHDLAGLFAKKYESSDLEKLLKDQKVLEVESWGDACVSQYYANKNFGMSDTLFAGRYSKQRAIYRTYLYFDICSLPTDMNIVNSTLKLNLYPIGLKGDTSLTIYPVLQNWQEDTICWRNQPQTAGDPYTGMYISPDTTESIEISITNLFKSWYSEPGKNCGILLQGDESVDALIAFKSKECPNVEMRPRLEIEYNC